MAMTEIYTLSLHDALPIFGEVTGPGNLRSAVDTAVDVRDVRPPVPVEVGCHRPEPGPPPFRSEEHTSELQSQSNHVCRLLLEKKNHDEAVPRFVYDAMAKA